jgi:hypothetical protein
MKNLDHERELLRALNRIATALEQGNKMAQQARDELLSIARTEEE